MKIFSRHSSATPPAQTSSGAPASQSAQPSMPSVRKTSQLPGGLRDLADMVTASRQKKSAASLTNEQLKVALSSTTLSGRGTRAAQREAQKRIRNGKLQWPPQQPAQPQTAAPQAQGHAGSASEPPPHTPHAQANPNPTPTPTEQPHAESSGTAHAEHTEHTEHGTQQDLAIVLRPPSPSPLSPSSSAHAQGRHTPPGAPVFDPDTGALNKPQLRQMALALKDALPTVPVALTRSHPLSDGLRAKLQHQLGTIQTIAADNTRKAPHEVGMAVRDAFASAAKTARRLAKSLGNHDPADAYKGIAALLTELKRTHLSGSAHEVMSHYAEKETANLEAKAPGISTAKPGSNVSTGTSGSVSISAFPTNRYAGAHVSVEAGGGKGRLYFADDDGDVDYWPSAQAFAKVALGGKLGEWAAKLTGRLDLSGGNVYLEHDDLRQLVKLVANHDANHAWVKSAGPHARQAMQQLESLANLVSHAIGRNYTEAAGKPYFLNDAKIAKGFNTLKMTLLAGAIDQKVGGERFSTLMKAAYPPIADVLTDRIGSGQPMPAQPRRDVPDSVAYGDRFLAYRQVTGSVDANVGNETHGGTNLEAGGSFDVNVRGNVAQFFTESAAAPHTLLDPGYHKDYQSTFKLHQQLDAACAEPPPAQLHLYNATRKALTHELHAGPAQPFTETERLHYGEEANIPAQFRNAITHASPEQLNHATDQLEHLIGTYLQFADHAGAVLAKNDRFMPAKERDTLNQHREAAFAQINQTVWHGRYPQKDALANPEAFVAKSHAAISLALGCVGAHISVVKQQMALREEHGTAAAEAILTADSMYKTAREMLDKTYLPLKNYDVQKNGPLKDKSLWQRWDTALKATVSGGAQSSALNAILNRFGRSSGKVQLGPFTGSISVGNSAGQVSLTAEARLMNANHQVNPSRTGKFWQFTFTAQGGAPITGAILNKAIEAAIEKFAPNMRLQDDKFDPHELLRQTQGLLLNVTDGTSLVVKLRQAPDVQNAPMELQYARVLRNKNSGMSLSLTVPTPHGTFTPSVSHTDSTQSYAGEVMGSDTSYLIMQHPFLAKIVDAEAHREDAALRQAFDANPVQRDRYLANPNLMADVVAKYAAATQEINAAAAENRPVQIKNEFVRYHAATPFARAAQVSTQVAAHAPGSTANGEQLFKLAEPLAKPIDVSHLDVEAMRARLQAMTTIEDRADYLCDSSQGRPLLDAFSKIIGNTRAINSAALFHTEERNTGIQSLVRNPKALQRENDRTQAALHGKPQPTGTVGQLRTRLEPAKASVKQANLADLQQLAAMNLPISQQAQQELQRRKALLGNAFPTDEGQSRT
ncbi:type III effector protein [Ralstonia sp. Ralssp135]|uniref:type III effector protein n=1 Tax=Ralstonia sp. Ralssp135 TaxID=3243016 RepID=UPI0039AF1793